MRLTEWELEARKLLKLELVKADLGYSDLSKLLMAMDVEETAGAIANKMARGKFSLVFFLQCMRALGLDTVTLSVPSVRRPLKTDVGT